MARPRLLSPLFLLIMLSTFAYFVSVGALVPTLPLYVKQVLRGGDVAVGVVIGSFALSAVVLRPLAGKLGDTRGRRLLIVAGAGLVAAAVAGYVLAGSLAPLLLLRLASGAGEACFYVGAASVINDLAPDERRGEAISYFSLALYGGLAAGPVIGETVLEGGAFSSVWMVSAGCALAAALLGMPVRDTRDAPSQDGYPTRLVHPAGLMPGIVMACSVCGLAGFNTFVPLYALDIGLGGSRAVFFLFSAIVMLIRSLGARIPDVMGPRRAAPTALALSAVGLWLIAGWSGATGLYAGTALFALGQALAFPALMTIAVGSAPASERAAVVGTFTAFFDLAFGGGSVGLGAVSEVAGYRGSFAVSGFVAAAAALLVVGKSQRRKKHRAAEMKPAA